MHIYTYIAWYCGSNGGGINQLFVHVYHIIYGRSVLYIMMATECGCGYKYKSVHFCALHVICVRDQAGPIIVGIKY